MLMIESWPAVGPAPRVRAAADPNILIDLAFPSIDMIVWARHVPDSWQADMRNDTRAPEPITIEGSLDRVLAYLRKRRITRAWPAFLLDDVAQSASLTAALGLSNIVTLTLLPLDQDGMEPPPRIGKLRTLCCYGAGVIDWNSGTSPDGPIVSSLSPYALAFARANTANAVHPRWTSFGDPCVGLCIDIW